MEQETEAKWVGVDFKDMEMQLLTRYILPGPTYHGELDGVQRVAGKNLSVETGIDHCRLKIVW